MTNNKEMLSVLEKSLAKLQSRTTHVKEHYLTLMIMLTESFLEDSESQCIMLFKDNDALAVCASNISEAESIGMVQECLKSMLLHATEDAPEKAMFN